MRNETQSISITRDQLIKAFRFWIEYTDEKSDGIDGYEYVSSGMTYQDAAEQSADALIAVLKQLEQQP